jgi:hypothetical protein
VVAVTDYELVIHHDYTSGGCADLSGHANDGHRLPEGSDPAVFDGQHTRVVVLPTAGLADLGGIRVKARVWLDELGDRRTIMEGYLAFCFAIEPDGALVGSTYADLRWQEITTAPGAVPLREWVDVTFGYDGRDTATLSVGDAVTTRYAPLGRVGGVQWPYGLNIGSWPDHDLRVFSGRIAQVWLWRTRS